VTNQACHNTSNRKLQTIFLTIASCWYIEIKVEDDLLPPGAKPGTIPTDLDQSTGLERLELIGKMQGIDIFDMRPLDASRKGMSLTNLSEFPNDEIPADRMISWEPPT
jgi:PIN domain nuclease of toxin-antitoxin system